MEVQILNKKIEIKALVSSESVSGAYYVVEFDGEDKTCTCPQYIIRGIKCKHIREVEDILNL